MLDEGFIELLLWEVSEQIKPSDYDKLGVRLTIDPLRVETIAQDTPYTTEAIFKLLLEWQDNQTTNPVNKLQELLTDFDIHLETEPALSTTVDDKNIVDSQLRPIELYSIAEKLRDEKYIELGIRLHVRYNDLTDIRKRYSSNTDIHYHMLSKWQKDESNNTQVETLVTALKQSHQRHLADQVYVAIGVTAEGSIDEEAKATFQEIKTLLTKLTKSRSGPRKNGETVDELENVRKWCVRCIHLLRKLQKHIGQERKYEMSGFKLTNDLQIGMRAYDETGLERLREDVSNGILARRLVIVLISQDVLAKKGRDLFQVKITGEIKRAGKSSKTSNRMNGNAHMEHVQNGHSRKVSADNNQSVAKRECLIHGQKRRRKQESSGIQTRSKKVRSRSYKY